MNWSRGDASGIAANGMMGVCHRPNRILSQKWAVVSRLMQQVEARRGLAAIWTKLRTANVKLQVPNTATPEAEIKVAVRFDERHAQPAPLIQCC